jgi:hypothetical protein
MSLLDNQTYKKKIAFVKSNDHDKTVQFMISIQCNHNIEKNILTDIEATINEMFLKDYENMETIEKQKKIDQQLAKKDSEIQKQLQKQQMIKAKENQKLLLQQKQNQLDNKTVHLSSLISNNKNKK